MPIVFIAGATGYLGRFLCTEYKRLGWTVYALVRNKAKAGDLDANRLTEAQAIQPETLIGAMDGAELVVSALGITRQADGLGYWDVDYQGNANLLAEAQAAGVKHFAYIHVLNADQMPDVPLVAAKSAFVRKLRGSSLRSTVIAPSGYFSDMTDFLSMARNGRVWLFGSGQWRLNPIHGADLASVTFETIESRASWRNVGGPDIFTQDDLAKLCFETLGKPARLTHLPDAVRRAALSILPKVAPRRIAGPAQFFLSAMGMDMVGEPYGTRHLADHFNQLASSR